MSHIFRLPLSVPSKNSESEVGWYLFRVMLSLMSYRFFPLMQSAKTYGLLGFSMFHKNACTSSVEIKNCSLKDTLTLLIEVMCLLGKVTWLMASSAFSTTSNFGIFISFPPDFPTFLKHFSNNFHTLMFLSLVVISFWYFPWAVSHCMSLMVYETCSLFNGSNSLLWDWNSAQYSSASLFLDVVYWVQKIMILPAWSPNAKYFPVLSNDIFDMISSS